MLDQAAEGPESGALERALLVRTGVHQGGELIEGEDDVCTELVLDLHRHLGSEAMGRAVEVRLERHAVVIDAREPFLAVGGELVVGVADLHGDDLLEAGAERHDLESAAVGVGRTPPPVHEGTEPAGLIDDLGTRLQVEVVGIREDRLRAQRGDRLGQDGLHGRLVPTG